MNGHDLRLSDYTYLHNYHLSRFLPGQMSRCKSNPTKKQVGPSRFRYLLEGIEMSAVHVPFLSPKSAFWSAFQFGENVAEVDNSAS